MDSEATDTQPDNPGYPDIHVGQTCYVQTAESRFGPGVLEDLRNFVHEVPHENEVDFDEDDVEDDFESDGGVVEVVDGPEALMLMEAIVDPVEAGLEPDPHQDFPRIATTRNNLTALSQRYNLYFAAYQDRIYVYQPQRAPRILPSPSLVLRPRQSVLAMHVGGVIDRNFPHQINHLIVGNLGNLEIVLVAYDDGDVAAYYTHALVHWIEANSSDQAHGAGGHRVRRLSRPKPFFHENVGKSAWGLAIHEKSRLIAVGSNLHEVTVFAFAVNHRGMPAKFSETDNSWVTTSDEATFRLQKHFKARTRTWRITLPLGSSGNNIPNLTFVDDEAGEADRVAAIDILGTVWILDIWRIGANPIKWTEDLDTNRLVPGSVKGWGVLVFRDSDFRPARNVRECLGTPPNEVLISADDGKGRTWLDSTCSLYYVKDLSPILANVFRHRTRLGYNTVHATKPAADCESELSDAGDESDSEIEAEDATPESSSGARISLKLFGLVLLLTSQIPFFDKLPDNAQLNRSIIPTFGELTDLDGDLEKHLSFTNNFQERKQKTTSIAFAKAELPAHWTKDFHLLRTSLTDIRLEPFDRAAPGVHCRFVLPHHPPGLGSSPWDMHPVYSERVSMLIHVPELNLVVAGSPTGRVALVTLTRTARRLQGSTPVRHGFRVDRVLPRRAEDKRGLRPSCTLIGVAVSPVPHRRARGLDLYPPPPSGGAETRRELPPPVMYRLILHYKDHTILMYEIARGLDEEEDLMIF